MSLPLSSLAVLSHKILKRDGYLKKAWWTNPPENTMAWHARCGSGMIGDDFAKLNIVFNL